ncbi:MAG: hypothetical protein ACKOGA_12715 [Planctomycetaceae bacterium]
MTFPMSRFVAALFGNQQVTGETLFMSVCSWFPQVLLLGGDRDGAAKKNK